MSKLVCLGRTIDNVAVFDLLQDLGPDVGVAFLVRLYSRGLEVDNLSNASDWRHCVRVQWFELRF